MYRPTIGLEVHAELATKTKMFCDSANDPNETRPNINTCPICLAHPGTLPVINREAVRHILRIGTAVNGALADFSEFDRKSYFYPDIPKGYQISQYKHPLVTAGMLAGVMITRVHLEEDTARSIHLSAGKAGAGGLPAAPGHAAQAGKSIVDFNRAGIPLMELVTEPVIPDVETAGRFARELQLLLRTLHASEANLEKGEMRVEANVSVSDREGEFGTKVEIKNLNSFRSVERAIAFEIKRQTALIENGEKVAQETRGWDEAKQKTSHQRLKEGSADYRYFPEPDLPKLFLSEISELSQEAIRASLPELPWIKRERLRREYKLKEEVIELFIQNIKLGMFFEKVVSGKTPDFIRLAVNYITSDLISLMKSKMSGAIPSAKSFRTLIEMVMSNKLSSHGAKSTLAILYSRSEGDSPVEIARKHNLIQVHDSRMLGTVVDTVLAQEGKAVLEYKSGKQAALQHLVGKAMRESRGAGNPLELQKLIIRKIG